MEVMLGHLKQLADLLKPAEGLIVVIYNSDIGLVSQQSNRPGRSGLHP